MQCVCVRWIGVGIPSLRTSTGACRRTASSTAAAGEGEPQLHQAVGGLTSSGRVNSCGRTKLTVLKTACLQDAKIHLWIEPSNTLSIGARHTNGKMRDGCLAMCCVKTERQCPEMMCVKTERQRPEMMFINHRDYARYHRDYTRYRRYFTRYFTEMMRDISEITPDTDETSEI